MMTMDQLNGMFDHLRLCHGIAMRVLEAFPEQALDRRLIAGMRTPRELAVHLYQTVRGLPEGVAAGQITDFEAGEAAVVERLADRNELLAFCRQCWDAGAAAAGRLTDEHLAAPVRTSWGAPVAGWKLISALQDEFFHHRGQLYAFLRAAGVKPPDMWDFAGNAPDYRPRVTPQPA